MCHHAQRYVVAVKAKADTEMAVVYPLEFHRRSERQWQRCVKAPTQPRQDDTSTKTPALRGFTDHKVQDAGTSSNIVDDDYFLDGRIIRNKAELFGISNIVVAQTCQPTLMATYSRTNRIRHDARLASLSTGAWQ
jgi:hypothetical protein